VILYKTQLPDQLGYSWDIHCLFLWTQSLKEHNLGHYPLYHYFNRSFPSLKTGFCSLLRDCYVWHAMQQKHFISDYYLTQYIVYPEGYHGP